MTDDKKAAPISDIHERADALGLEHTCSINDGDDTNCLRCRWIEAQLSAVAQPAPAEPVAWEYRHFQENTTGYKYELRALYTCPPAQPNDARDADRGLLESQEPKYTVDGQNIINRASGKPIPDDEPVFIFRASDVHALDTLAYYASAIESVEHSDAVWRRVNHFERFRRMHRERMKEPDTAMSRTEQSGEGE